MPYLVNLVSTMAVFCGCTWKLALLQVGGGDRRHYATGVLCALCYMAIAVGMLGIFLRDFDRHSYVAPWYLLVLRIGLTVLFVYPWKRRAGDA